MLVLSTLTKLLEQVVAPEDVHTAVLLTPGGELIAYASAAPRPKDEVLLLVGLGGEVWSETKETGEGMVESELGRILITSAKFAEEEELNADVPEHEHRNGHEQHEPLCLIALNASDSVPWETMQLKATRLAEYLFEPLRGLEDRLAKSTASTGKVTSSKPERPGR